MMNIEDIVKNKTNIFKENSLLDSYVEELVNINPQTPKEFEKACITCRRKFKTCPKKAHIISRYRHLVINGKLEYNEDMENLMVKKLVRKSSGVQVITVLTSPYPEFTDKTSGERKKQKFSCGKDCYYCPNEREVVLSCWVDKQLEQDEKFSKFQVTSMDDLDEVEVVTYFMVDAEKYPIISSRDYNKETKTFTMVVMNKFAHLLEKDCEIKVVKVEQPRSYISTEPAVRRANANNFDPVLQFYDRAMVLKECGHIIDKIEVLVLGGTWSHYPVSYQEEFIRDIYYSANTFNDSVKREKMSLEDEIEANQTAQSRIIGLTLETRPDCITKYEIRRFRKYGCTRVQIGVQHIDDSVLLKINRGCYTKDTINAIFLLKQNGFKVDIHLMPDLYGSTYEKDIAMFDKLLGVKEMNETRMIDWRPIKLGSVTAVHFMLFYMFYNIFMWIPAMILLYVLWGSINVIRDTPREFSIKKFRYKLAEPKIQADQWKIYPTEVVRWTKLFDLFKEGEYKPYAEEINDATGNKKIVDVILHAMRNVYPWIRLNRVIRDIPTTEIYGGNLDISMRGKLEQMLVDEGNPCKCIRYREVGKKKINVDDVQLVVREYRDNRANEYFISFESKDLSTIYGFCRLRLNETDEGVQFDELKRTALIRELHVYGMMIPHATVKKATQHLGFGKRLLKTAERISCENGFKRVAVISGIGVRQYYEKNGYKQNGTYMVKTMSDDEMWH